MAFESNNFNVVKKVRLPQSEFSVECNVPLAEGAAKVLAVKASPAVTSSEVLAGSVNYAGSIDLKVVYLTADGELGCENCSCPFTSKFESEAITAGSKATISVSIIEHNIEKTGENNVKIVCTLKQSGSLILTSEVQSVQTSDEDVCCKNEEIQVIRFVGDVAETINVESELTIREPVKKLILTESQAIVKNAEGGAGFVSVSGEVVTRVLYLTENDKFETGYVYETFKEEVDLEGASRLSEVEAYAFVKCNGVKAELEQNDKSVKVSVIVPVELMVKAYEQSSVTVVKDLYSTKHELSVSTTSFDMTVVCPTTLVEGKIDGTLTLDEESPRVDKIMFVGGNNIAISNSYIANGEINVEGIASTSVVYLNDETGSLHSVQIDVPFVINEKFENQSVDGIIDAEAIVCDVDVVVKKGREFYYDAKVKVSVNYCHPEVSGVISGAEAMEEYDERDYGMELLFAHAGADAWDIAKQARIKEEMLLLQNPEASFPLQEDKNLILFYQKRPY